MVDVAIRSLVDGDVEDVARFHRRTVVLAYAGIFPPEAPPPTEDQLREEWLAEPGLRWLATEGAAVVGTIVTRGDEIRRLLVDPDRWGNGIGSRLLDVAVAAIREAGHDHAHLWVLEENDRGRRFYASRGWALQPGLYLTNASGPREVRYRLPLGPGAAAVS